MANSFSDALWSDALILVLCPPNFEGFVSVMPAQAGIQNCSAGLRVMPPGFPLLRE